MYSTKTVVKYMLLLGDDNNTGTTTTVDVGKIDKMVKNRFNM